MLRERVGHSKHLLPTNTGDDAPHGHHQMVNTEIRLIIFFSAKDGEALYSQEKKKKKNTGADCGSVHELLIAKFRLKLKKVGKTTRPFTNHIPFDYTVEVINRFKRLDPMDRVPEELWTEVRNIVQEVVIKTIPKRKKHKKTKLLSQKALGIGEKKRKK